MLHPSCPDVARYLRPRRCIAACCRHRAEPAIFWPRIVANGAKFTRIDFFHIHVDIQSDFSLPGVARQQDPCGLSSVVRGINRILAHVLSRLDNV